MQAILVWFDRLPYGLLGCCGNTRISMQGFDHLAASAVSCERCFAADLRRDGAGPLLRTIEEISATGLSVSVIAERASLVGQQAATAMNGVNVKIVEPETSHPDDLIDALRAAVGERQGNRLTVVALAGIPALIEDFRSKSTTDALADADGFVASLIDLINSVQVQTVLMLTAGEGMANSPVERADSLYRPLGDIQTHVPLFVQLSATGTAGIRSRVLMSNSDGLACLAAACTSESWEWQIGHNLLCDESLNGRNELVLSGRNNLWALRTSEWLLIAGIDNDVDPGSSRRAANSATLFIKPDDLWDQLDVADQYPDIVERLTRDLVEFVITTGDGRGTCRY